MPPSRLPLAAASHPATLLLCALDADGEDGSGSEEEEGGNTFAGPAAGRGMGSKAKVAALELLQGGAGADDEAPATGLFALPFMRRALDRKKLEAQQAAQEVLRELEGEGGVEDAAAAAANGGGGAVGRLAFSGTGVDQRKQWERVARKEAAARDGDSDLGSDAVSGAACAGLVSWLWVRWRQMGRAGCGFRQLQLQVMLSS